VAFRLKVPDTSNFQDMAQIYVGRLSDKWPNPEWEWITRRYVAPPERMTDVPRFAEDFEKAGGITLSAEEFLAALNPKYMIKLAEKLAGAQDPDVVQAKALLGSGDYMGSLLAARKALKKTGHDRD